MCSTFLGTIDPAFVDTLVAARTASRKLRDGKRDEANGAVLAAAIADFEAMIVKLLDRQRAIEERQSKFELETAATLSALLMVRTQ